jgi:hypothetical protein
MSWNFSELINEVQQRLRSQSEYVEGLHNEPRVGAWINQSIRRIVRENPGLRDVDIVDKHTWKCQSGKYEYFLRDFVDKPVAHLLGLRFMDASNSDYYPILPYPGGIDKFDKDYPCPTDATAGRPEYYILRGKTVEVISVPGSNEDAASIWVWYSYSPRDISGTTKPVLTDFDEPILAYATSAALRAAEQYADADKKLIYAKLITQERVEGEADVDTDDTIVDEGP